MYRDTNHNKNIFTLIQKCKYVFSFLLYKKRDNMRKLRTLDTLAIGKTAHIVKLKAKGQQRRRMLDLGMTQQTVIEAVQKSPCGDPTAYFIKGSLVALRNEDAKTVLII